MKSRYGILVLTLAVSMLAAGETAIRQTFAPGQYPGWQVGGSELQLIQRSDSVELNACGTTWARLIRPVTFTPGRSYRIRVKGSGPLDLLFRKRGFGPVNIFAARDIFASGPEFEMIYRPSAEYPAGERLMFRPAKRNTPEIGRAHV